MNDFKSFFTSKTIWGALVAGASLMAGRFGYDLGDAVGWVADLVGLAGVALSLYGRVKAVKRIAPPGV